MTAEPAARKGPAMADAAPKNLFEALARFQADLPKIIKGETAEVKSERTGQKFSYKYADLADISRAVLPLLGKVGLTFTARPTVQDGQFILAYSLVHVSGEREDGIYPLPAGGTPQAIGSAITYARRYCLCAVTGAAPAGDDDDAAAAQNEAGQTAGDAWETASQGRPRQQQRPENGQQHPRAVPAAQRPAETVPPPDGRPWLDQALEQAAGLKSERAADKLWREAVSKVNDGAISREDYERVRELISASVEDLRQKAFRQAMSVLAENEPWRDKIDELASGEDADAALAELEPMPDRKRQQRIAHAITARVILARWNLADPAREVA